MTVLLAATAAVVVGSWRFTLSLGLQRAVDTVSAWLVVLAAQLCLLVLGVGLAGQLRPTPLLLAAGVVAFAQVLWSLTSARDTARRSGRAVWGALGRAARRPWRHPVLLVLGLLVLAQYLWRLAIAVRFPVLDWDGNAYHLISVDNWVQQEAVTHSPQSIFADVYPQNSELITAWSATFLHSTWLAGLTQFLFAAMGFAAVVGIASNAGARRSLALFAGLLFAATPIVFLQAGTGYVDIAASATVLVAWQLVLSAYDLRGEPPGRLVPQFLVAGLAVGMMLGTKSSNVLGAVIAVLIAALVLRSLWQASRPPEPVPPPPDPTGGPADGLAGGGGTTVLTAAPAAARTAVRQRFGRWAVAPLCALLIPAVVVGGFWYVRNLVTYGNPLWPITIPFFQGQGSVQQLIIGGNIPAEIAHVPPLTKIFQSWSADLFAHPFLYDQRLGGFGPQWLLLGPAILAMVFGFLRDRVVYLLGLLIPFCVLLMLQPASWWSRFTIFFVGLGAVCFVLAARWVGGRWERVLHAGVVLLVGVGMWWSVSPTYLSATGTDPLSPAQAFQLLRADEPTRSATRFPWTDYTDLADAPNGSVVAIPDRTPPLFTHPYVGTELRRRLVIIPTPGDLAALRANLADVRADFVVLDPKTEATAALARDALLDPGHFAQVGTTYDGLLFAVR